MRTSALVAALLLAACAEDKVVNLPLHLEAPACESADSGRPLFCGGTIVVELYEITDAGQQLLARHCSSFAPDAGIAGLSNLDGLLAADPPRFNTLHGGQILVRAGVFSPAMLTGCPPLALNAFEPVEGTRYAIAQGDSLVTNVAEATSIDVTLDCVGPVPFACDEGGVVIPEVNELSATVIDLGTLASHGDGLRGQALVILGFLGGEPGPVEATGPDGMQLALFQPLTDLIYGGSGIWTTPIDPGFFFSGLCMQVVRRSDPPVTSCDVKYDEAAKDAYTTGYTLDDATRANVLRALGTVQIPPRGLVIGRVVDADRHPVSDVEVGDLNGLIHVKTLRSDFNGLTLDGLTDAGGWFAVDESGFEDFGATCCETLVASTSDGRSASVELLGLVDDSITATVIELPEL